MHNVTANASDGQVVAPTRKPKNEIMTNENQKPSDKPEGVTTLAPSPCSAYEGWMIHSGDRYPGDQEFRPTQQVLVVWTDPRWGPDFRWVGKDDPRAALSLRRADAGEEVKGYNGYRMAAFRRSRPNESSSAMSTGGAQPNATEPKQ